MLGVLKGTSIVRRGRDSWHGIKPSSVAKTVQSIRKIEIFADDRQYT